MPHTPNLNEMSFKEKYDLVSLKIPFQQSYVPTSNSYKKKEKD